MKALNLPIIVCCAALSFTACGDSSSVVSADTTDTTDTTETSTTSGTSGTASSSSQEVIEQEVSDPVDVSELEGDPILTFAAGSVTVTNDNGCISQDGNVVSITCSGNYQLTGNSTDNQVQVQTADSDAAGVYLYLNSLQLASASDAPLYVRNADKVLLVLVDGTSNTLEDASTRTATFTKSDGTLDTTKAAIYAKDDLTIKGNGTLKVTGNYNNGIHTTNDLRFRDVPQVTVTASNNALKGKGSVSIEGGYYTLTATGGDGIKSDEGEEEGVVTDGKGIVVITGGEISVTAGDDGIQAYNYILLDDSVSTPKITVKSTGKGIVSDNRIYVNAGITSVTATDDGMHSNLNIYFNGGETTISSGDDGVHADSTLRIAGGSVNVTKAVEGLEAFYIRAEGGMTAVYTSDDAWNAAGGSADGSTSSGSQWGGPGGGGAASSSKGYIIITGGYHYLYAGGSDVDVLDANGTATMSGGVVILEMGSSGGAMRAGGFNPGGNQSGTGSCSTNMAGGLIDTDSGFSISGGVMLGFGSQTEEYPNCTATSFSAGTAYGASNAAFKPSVSGSMIIYGGDVSSVSQVDVSGMTAVTLPNGMVYYEK